MATKAVRAKSVKNIKEGITKIHLTQDTDYPVRTFVHRRSSGIDKKYKAHIMSNNGEFVYLQCKTRSGSWSTTAYIRLSPGESVYEECN